LIANGTRHANVLNNALEVHQRRLVAHIMKFVTSDPEIEVNKKMYGE